MDNQQLQDYEFKEPKQGVPYATPSLVLGIASIIACCSYGLPGIICGIIGLVLSGKGMDAYRANPLEYTPGSYKMLNAGRTCAIIGLIISSIAFIGFIIMIAVGGMDALMNPETLFDSY